MLPKTSLGIFAASIALAAWISTVSSASALTLAISSSPPSPSPADVYNLTGAANDEANVNDGGTYSNGVDNDVFTYVAGDRPAQGQTFTTGANPKGYTLTSLWVRHVGYTRNLAPTYWKMTANGSLTLRITDPARAGSKSFVILSETYQTTGLEDWANTPQNSPNGSGAWLKFTFNAPIALLPNKTYGFDLSSSSLNAFFEWLGTSANPFLGGSAYQGSRRGGADMALNCLVGDRVFLVELSQAGSDSTSTAPAPLPNAATSSIEEDATNTLILSAANGSVKGKTAKLTRRSENDFTPTLEFWSNPADSVRWDATVLTPGIFDVLLKYAVVGDGPGSRVEVAVGNQGVQCQLDPTPDLASYRTHFLGQVEISRAGVTPVNLSVLEKHGQLVMNFRSICLRRSESTHLEDPPTPAIHPALP